METTGQTDEERTAAALLALSKNSGGESAQPTAQSVITPTNVAPDAPIAAAQQQAQAQIEPVHPQVYQPKTPAAVRDTSRLRGYIVLAVVWLVGVPVAIILNGLATSKKFGDAVNVGLTVASYVFGLYGVFGWIPLAMKYFRDHKEGW